MPTTIYTDRLTLKKLAIDDHDFMLELVNSTGWLEFIGSRNVHSAEDAIQYIEKINNTPDFTYWVVRTNDALIPIGIVSFLKRSYLNHFDIGFAFLAGYQGNGYGYEAAASVLAMVTENPRYATIFATTVPHNKSSIRLLTKLGFRFYQELDIGTEKLHVYANIDTKPE
jgi:[ribosomal protein S5]-alanine N-acetyltransferase